MGMAKRYMEEVAARGWRDVDRTIGSRCVTDQALVELIRGEGGTFVCDYCGEEPVAPDASAAFEVMLEAVVDGIRHEYERPVDTMGWASREGGWLGAPTFDTYDLLWDLEITEREDVHAELLSAIVESEWCEYDPYSLRPHEALASGREHFREYVKHERRYTFFMAKEDWTLGAADFPMDRVPFAVTEAAEAAMRVTLLPAGSAWWRGRPHRAGEPCWTAAKELSAAPAKLAKDNRMSAKGVSAFYGASTSAGARAEIAGYSLDDADIGLFETHSRAGRCLTCADPPRAPSLFSQARYRRAATRFLHAFIEDISKTADPSDEQVLDYIPTQIIAEFFRNVLVVGDEHVKGVLWKSSKDSSVDCCESLHRERRDGR